MCHRNASEGLNSRISTLSGKILRARLPNPGSNNLVDITIEDGLIKSIEGTHGLVQDLTQGTDQDVRVGVRDARGSLIGPSLCHPHVHLDKAFILSHPRFRHLQIAKGTFQEAMDLTSKAKQSFTLQDLLERGQRMIDESCKAGVTHMRAFVEVDEVVGLMCLEAGAELKEKARQKGLCHVQLCAFAQLPLHPMDSSGDKIRSLMREAMHPRFSVDVVGSTPYVERDWKSGIENIKWMVDLALEHDKYLDFHLDYNVDPKLEPMIFKVIESLKARSWNEQTSKSIVLGHCTRLVYFKDDQWQHLAAEIGDLPISFVGLPTSDLYMMKAPVSPHSSQTTELRTTLPIPQMIQKYGLNCAIGMNNIGNAFTPHGVCDPLYLANLGVGLYQTGTTDGARLLYECVSTRARAAIGFAPGSQRTTPAYSVDLLPGQPANFILFDNPPPGFEDEHKIEDQVYYYTTASRTTVWGGL
ncbi:hypothetical protein ANO11243_078500 [Dothideomycetidae sp. 11243]|nr:hypothetical protein ANO11243_078500 [fungal sp. No.11243]